MKIIKNIPTNKGYDAEYIVIEGFEINYREKVGRLIFFLYKDKQAYENGSQPIDLININIKTNEFDQFESSVKIKGKIKQFLTKQGQIFEGAQDDEE